MNLHIGDKYKRIVDVMNNCFGWNYKACFKGWVFPEFPQEDKRLVS